MLLVLLAYAWIRDQYLTGLPDDVHNPDAAAAIFDITTRFAVRALRALLVLGVLVMLGAWVVGPSTTAARVRSWLDILLGRSSDFGAERELGPLPGFASTHARALMGGVAVLGLLTLVLWTHPTGLVVLLIAVVTLLILGAIRFFAEVGRRTGDTPRTNDRRIDLRDSGPDSAPDQPDRVRQSSNAPDRT